MYTKIKGYKMKRDRQVDGRKGRERKSTLNIIHSCKNENRKEERERVSKHQPIDGFIEIDASKLQSLKTKPMHKCVDVWRTALLPYSIEVGMKK